VDLKAVTISFPFLKIFIKIDYQSLR